MNICRIQCPVNPDKIYTNLGICHTGHNDSFAQAHKHLPNSFSIFNWLTGTFAL